MANGVYIALVSESRLKELLKDDGSEHHASLQYTPVSSPFSELSPYVLIQSFAMVMRVLKLTSDDLIFGFSYEREDVMNAELYNLVSLHFPLCITCA